MNTSSLIIRDATASRGDDGGPHLTLDCVDGERVYVTFADGEIAYRGFAHTVAARLDRAAKARLAVQLLSDVGADMRSDVIAEVVGRYSTPRVTVRPETIATIYEASRAGMDASA